MVNLDVRFATLDNSLRGVQKTADVTLDGADTQQLYLKPMAVVGQLNLCFIGEVVDVTGHLGDPQLSTGLGVWRGRRQ